VVRSNRQEKQKFEQDSDSEHELNNGYRKKSIKQVISQDSLSNEKAFFDSVISLDQNAKVLKVNSQHIEKHQEIVIKTSDSLSNSLQIFKHTLRILQ